MPRKIKAKNVTGALRLLYDKTAIQADYADWQAFITDLHLQDEDATDCFLVLKDMIDDGKETLIP